MNTVSVGRAVWRCMVRERCHFASDDGEPRSVKVLWLSVLKKFDLALPATTWCEAR